jgi:hypothetical protein
MKRVLVAAFVLLMGVSVPAGAQDGPLIAAKELYATARYEEALTVLNSLRGRELVDRRSVEQYRSLCLLALGRASEAESAIAAVVTADPTYRPGDDTSPRVRATFSDVRRRLLPEVTTSRYVAAKGAYDLQRWAEAEQQFRVVLSLIDDPDTGGKLGDLRVLTVGFLELSARNAAPPPPPPAPEPKPEPPPAAAPTASLPVAPTAPPAASRTAAPAGPVRGHVYSADDRDVTPPTILRQQIPAVPANVVAVAKPRGLLEVVIDEQGRVVAMAMRGSIHPAYDAQILASARDWKYKPAIYGGQPVRFRKLIQVAVKR